MATRRALTLVLGSLASAAAQCDVCAGGDTSWETSAMPPKSKKRRAGKGFDTHKPEHEKKVKQEIGTYEVLDELDGVKSRR